MSNENHSNFEHRYKTWHTYLSLLKSMIRIVTSISVTVACWLDAAIPLSAIGVLAAGYGIAEIIGILEEL